MRAAIAVVALALATPAGAQEMGEPHAAPPLREFSTDRPDKTESPYTVDAGHLQVEADLANWTRTREDGVRATELALGTVNLKLGLAHSADVQVIVSPYLRQAERDLATGARGRRTGFGDLTVRLKRNLWGDDGGPTAFALMPYVTLPSADDDVGAGLAEFGLIAPLAVTLTDKLGLGVMTEVDWTAREGGGERAAKFVNSATLGAHLSEKWGAYAELWTERSTERGSGWAVTGDVGVTFLVADDTQLDAGANLGLTREADDLNLFVGVSRRF